MSRSKRPSTNINDIPNLVFPSELLDEKRNNPEERELEVRFSHPQYPINARLLHSVKTEISNRYRVKPIIEQSTVLHYRNNIRSVKINNEKITYEYKKELDSTYFSSNYPYKVALSEERKISKKDRPKEEPISKTTRYRTSFLLSDNIRVDLTFAREQEGNKPENLNPSKKGLERDKYRIEIEVIDADNIDVDTVIKEYLFPILSFVLESPILLTLQTLNYIRTHEPFQYTYNNRTLHLRADKPEDLLVHDLTQDGLFGTERYVVTIKTDGLRKFLLLFGDSVYLVGIHGIHWSFSRIYRKEGSILPMQGTLLDGELINDYRKDTESDIYVSFYDPDAHFTYWAFDLLAYHARSISSSHNKIVGSSRNDIGNISENETEDILVITTLEQTPFMRPQDEEPINPNYADTRLSVLQVLCTAIKGSRFSINCKSFVRCDGPDLFFSACKSVLEAEYPFNIDGLIFVSMDRPYLTRQTVHNREIDVTYTRKWKDVKNLTIDFLKRGDRLYVVNRGNIIPFTGSKKFPWDGKYLTNIDETEIEDGQIVEFAFLNIDEDQEEGEEASKQFVPIKYRPDKESPSSVKAAGDVWQLLHDPVQRITIIGESFQLMRRYHNRIKRELIGELVMNSRDLDIGSGQGGDIFSWDINQLRVSALEVNEEQSQRFNERLKELIDRKKKEHVPYKPDTIKLYDFGGQDPKVRDLGSFNSATLFFVITFFSGEDLDNLISNLSHGVVPGGKIYLTGFDARKYASLLPGYEDSISNANNDIKKLKIKYRTESTVFELNKNKVKLYLNGTLVGTRDKPQEEYAIDYEELMNKLENNGFHIDESSFLTQETFLSEDEERYTRSTRLLILTRGIDEDKSVDLESGDEDIKKERIDSLQLPSPPEVNVFIMGEEGQPGYDIDYGLLPLLGDIDAGERRDFEYLGYPLVRIGALGDGNCLLHSACEAISDRYHEMEPDEQIKFVRELRREMSSDLTEELYEKLGDGQVSEVYSFKDYKRFLNSKGWLGDEFIDLFERTFEVEVIILWFTENHGIIPSIAKERAKQYPHSIILLCLGNVHYETVGFRHIENKKESIYTFFSYKHRLIVTLRDRMNKKSIGKSETEKKKISLSTKISKISIEQTE